MFHGDEQSAILCLAYVRSLISWALLPAFTTPKVCSR